MKRRTFVSALAGLPFIDGVLFGNGKLNTPDTANIDSSDENTPPERWGVYIECDSESNQKDVLEELNGDGFVCRELQPTMIAKAHFVGVFGDGTTTRPTVYEEHSEVLDHCEWRDGELWIFVKAVKYG
jgi:hypothetical protein